MWRRSPRRPARRLPPGHLEAEATGSGPVYPPSQVTMEVTCRTRVTHPENCLGTATAENRCAGRCKACPVRAEELQYALPRGRDPGLGNNAGLNGAVHSEC